jgi:branched-chain amino acid transport system ATP-binding protein
MDVVFGYAHRIIVLDRGQIVAAGSPSDVRASPKVRQIYLGDEDPGSMERATA